MNPLTQFNLSRWNAKLRMLLGRADATALMDYGKRTIRIGVSSPVEYHTRLFSCMKEPETVDWIERFSPGDVFYDVGANVGAYSLIAAAYWQGKVKVVSIEPSAYNFNRLVRNISLNRLEHWITPLPVALAERTGLTEFHYTDTKAGSALHALGAARDFRDKEFDPALSCRMMGFSLDELIDLFRLPPPTHLKLDVDGTELKILRGAARTLRSVRSVLVEQEAGHPQTPGVNALLAENGFKADSRHPYRFAQTQPQFASIENVIFSKETR